jgi:amidohydrolase
MGRLTQGGEEQVGEGVREVIGGVDGMLPAIDAFYRDLHEHPELSGMEERTSGKVAARLEAAGYEVTGGIGGWGVVGLLRNGDGPVVGLRGDMDALPVREETGLPYASRVTVTRDDGTTAPVMHACGHDLHTGCLVGTAELLATYTDRWRGTVLAIAQPAEETLRGAAAMLADGLFTRFPRPDVVFAQHALNSRAGMLHHRPGAMHAAARNLRVRIFGKGGHGSQPHLVIDPVVMAAQVVVQLQTIVSREVSPYESAVVTVGSIHGGTRYNIVPAEVTLELTTRGVGEPLMDQLQHAIERIAEGVCAAGRAPRPPAVELVEQVYTNVNDPATVQRVRALHAALFGTDVVDLPVTVTGSEDFALYGMPGPGRYQSPSIPTAFWFLGTVPGHQWDASSGSALLEKAAEFPGPHTPLFAPDRQPSLRRGIQALTAAALSFLSA